MGFSLCGLECAVQADQVLPSGPQKLLAAETQPKSPEKQALNAGIRSQIPGPQLSRDKSGAG